MATTCPSCRSANTQSIVDRYQCLACAFEFEPVSGAHMASDAYPSASDVPPPPEPDEDEPEPDEGAEPEAKGRKKVLARKR